MRIQNVAFAVRQAPSSVMPSPFQSPVTGRSPRTPYCDLRVVYDAPLGIRSRHTPVAGFQVPTSVVAVAVPVAGDGLVAAAPPKTIAVRTPLGAAQLELCVSRAGSSPRSLMPLPSQSPVDGMSVA